MVLFNKEIMEKIWWKLKTFFMNAKEPKINLSIKNTVECVISNKLGQKLIQKAYDYDQIFTVLFLFIYCFFVLYFCWFDTFYLTVKRKILIFAVKTLLLIFYEHFLLLLSWTARYGRTQPFYNPYIDEDLLYNCYVCIS